MNKKAILVLFALFLVSFVSASMYGNDVDYKEKISKTYYNSEHNYVITRSIEAYYDNEDRESTYDYRHGYSYRKTAPYWANQHDVYLDDEDLRDAYDYRVYDSHRNSDNYRYDDEDYYYDDGDAGNRIQYRVIPYLGTVEPRKCYDYVPRGKLFYISCNDWLY